MFEEKAKFRLISLMLRLPSFSFASSSVFVKLQQSNKGVEEKANQELKHSQGLKALKGFKSSLKDQELAAARASPLLFALETGKMLLAFLS